MVVWLLLLFRFFCCILIFFSILCNQFTHFWICISIARLQIISYNLRISNLIKGNIGNRDSYGNRRNIIQGRKPRLGKQQTQQWTQNYWKKYIQRNKSIWATRTLLKLEAWTRCTDRVIVLCPSRFMRRGTHKIQVQGRRKGKGNLWSAEQISFYGGDGYTVIIADQCLFIIICSRFRFSAFFSVDLPFTGNFISSSFPIKSIQTKCNASAIFFSKVLVLKGRSDTIFL